MTEGATSFPVGETAVTRLAREVIEIVIPDRFMPEWDTDEEVLKLVGSPKRSVEENMELVDNVTKSIWETARRGDWDFLEIKVVIELMQAGYDSEAGSLVLGEPLGWIDPHAKD